VSVGHAPPSQDVSCTHLAPDAALCCFVCSAVYSTEQWGTWCSITGRQHKHFHLRNNSPPPWSSSLAATTVLLRAAGQVAWSLYPRRQQPSATRPPSSWQRWGRCPCCSWPRCPYSAASAGLSPSWAPFHLRWVARCSPPPSPPPCPCPFLAAPLAGPGGLRLRGPGLAGGSPGVWDPCGGPRARGASTSNSTPRAPDPKTLKLPQPDLRRKIKALQLQPPSPSAPGAPGPAGKKAGAPGSAGEGSGTRFSVAQASETQGPAGGVPLAQRRQLHLQGPQAQ